MSQLIKIGNRKSVIPVVTAANSSYMILC